MSRLAHERARYATLPIARCFTPPEIGFHRGDPVALFG